MFASRVCGVQVDPVAVVLCRLVGAVAAVEAAPPQAAKPRTVFKLPTPDLNLTRPAVEHPLMPVVRMATEGYRQVRGTVRDYTCIMVRRERVNGRLGPHEFIAAKVRHRQVQDGQVIVPFSVYLKFLKPASVAGAKCCTSRASTMARCSPAAAVPDSPM